MGAIRLNTSIPEEHQTFLTENPSLSASKLLQSKIEEVKHSIKTNPQLIEALKQIEQLKRAREITQRELIRATDFIKSKGLQYE